MAGNGVIKLRLIVDVDYVPNGAPEDVLRDMLRAIPSRAAGEGRFTGETAAVVDEWKARVEERG